MKSRRDVLKGMALGIGLAVPAGIAAKQVIGSQDASAQPTVDNKLAVAKAETPAPWQLFSPVQRGEEIAHGWSIAGLTGAVAGAYNLRLANADGRAATVHVCLKDEYSSGVVQSDLFDLVLMNGGEANADSEEDLAQVLTVVTEHMKNNEAFLSAEALAPLMSHEDRVAKFANDPKLQGVLV